MAKKAKKRPARKPVRRKVPKKPGKKRARVSASRRKPPARKPAARTAARRPATRPAAPNPVRQLAQRIVDLTVRQDDEGSFALYAPNVESAEMGMPPTVGVEALRQKFAGWRQMVSDSTWQARNVWVDGKTILIEWAGRITFAATGRQADLKEIAIHEVENGKIVRERFYYDRSVLQP